MKQQNILYGLIAFGLSALLWACGVKNGYVVGEYGKYPLSGEIIAAETNDSSHTVKGTMGLLWQGDSLRITLNQGRQLLRAKTGKDTLYLYEAPRGAESNLQAQAANDTTRQYTFYIPTRELFIIKYNDSLVYPVMPAIEPCEYPLEIKVMGRKNLNDNIRKQEGNGKKTVRVGILNSNTLLLESRAGTYFFNAGLYELGVDCDCIIDSTQTFTLHLDGSWQQYENGVLNNCGIMRKTGVPWTYEMANYKWQTVLFTDTTSIAGHIISLKEDKRRWKEKIPYAPNEYFYFGKTRSGFNYEFFKLYSCQQKGAFPFFYAIELNLFRLDGSTCGWIRINK